MKEDFVTEKNIQAVGALFKKHMTVPKVVAEIGLNYTQVRQLMELYFHEKSVVKCRKRVERLTGVNFSQVHSSPKKLARIKNVFGVYKQAGTLDKAGEILGITRERVRQILNLGTRYGLYHYDTREEVFEKRNQIVDSVTKEEAEGIIREKGREGLHEELNLGYKATEKIIKKYKLNVLDLRREVRMKNIMKEYNAAVQRLGRHPSATDLQRGGDTELRKLNTYITTYLGGLERFREEHGIKFTHLKKIPCERRIPLINDYCKRHKTFTRRELGEAIKVNIGVAGHILLDLRRQKKVRCVIPEGGKKNAYYEVIK